MNYVALLAAFVAAAQAGAVVRPEIERVNSMKKKGPATSEEQFRRGYSTAPVQVTLEGHEYVIPMHYLTPFGNRPGKSAPKYVTVAVFLPDFVGYREDNYRDPFDKRKITVFWGGAFGGSSPEAQLANLTKHLGVQRDPQADRHGLEGYRGKQHYEKWFAGRRQDGERVVFRCRYEAPDKAVVNPLCDTRYPNARNGYGLAYRFSAEHLPKWREIDERINALIMSWRTR
jgi:hypothetical protein